MTAAKDKKDRPITPDELAKAISASGFSQQQFAEMLGVHRITVNRWVNGKRAIDSLATKAIRSVLATA